MDGKRGKASEAQQGCPPIRIRVMRGGSSLVISFTVLEVDLIKDEMNICYPLNSPIAISN